MLQFRQETCSCSKWALFTCLRQLLRSLNVFPQAKQRYFSMGGKMEWSVYGWTSSPGSDKINIFSVKQCRGVHELFLNGGRVTFYFSKFFHILRNWLVAEPRCVRIECVSWRHLSVNILWQKVHWLPVFVTKIQSSG